MTLRSRILLCGGLLALASGRVFGAGEYQQARDGKTMIWNWSPKVGESASWSGDRDKDDYASGFGDLTWFNAKGKVFGLFYGNMVHGKFEGAVNVHTGGRVAHSYFVNGERVTAWARGSAKSTMTAPEAAVVEKRKAETEKLTARREKIERAEPMPAKETKITKAEAVRSPAAEKTARGPDSYHNEATEKPPTATVAEKKTEPVSAEQELPRDRPLSVEEELKRTEPAMHETPTRTFTEPTPAPTSEPDAERPEPMREIKQSPPPAIQETPPVLHRPITEQTPESTTSQESPESLSPPVSKESDVSVNSLVGPPSSLRAKPESSPPEKPDAERASVPKNAGRLTETDAINLADTEARLQGYQLDNYERPKVDHSIVKGRWTLFYTLKKNDNDSDSSLTLIVTVEDKDHKIEIRK